MGLGSLEAFSSLLGAGDDKTNIGKPKWEWQMHNQYDRTSSTSLPCCRCTYIIEIAYFVDVWTDIFLEGGKSRRSFHADHKLKYGVLLACVLLSSSCVPSGVYRTSNTMGSGFAKQVKHFKILRSKSTKVLTQPWLHAQGARRLGAGGIGI